MVVKPTVILEVIKDDPDDNRVLECAAAGEANSIVSGDRHLLQLRSYEGRSHSDRAAIYGCGWVVS